MNLETLKDRVTDIIGFMTMICTLVAVHQKELSWQWEGLIGMIVGFALFVIPDKVIANLLKRKAETTIKEKPKEEKHE